MSKIETVHEETYSDGRTLGVLINFERIEFGYQKKINSFVYYFRETDGEGIYVFFETIVDMNDFMLYRDEKVKRAYMKEEDFDLLYDEPFKGKFEDHLNWT
jgi:hypothetical protein